MFKLNDVVTPTDGHTNVDRQYNTSFHVTAGQKGRVVTELKHLGQEPTFEVLWDNGARNYYYQKTNLLKKVLGADY